MFDWMAWTPGGDFLHGIADAAGGMTVWEIVADIELRKGFLPIATTRGDRLFISLLARPTSIWRSSDHGQVAAWFQSRSECGSAL